MHKLKHVFWFWFGSLLLLAGGCVLDPGDACPSGDCYGNAHAQDSQQHEHKIDSMVGDHAAVQRFLEQLQDAVAADDRKTVANMVSYPLNVDLYGNESRILNPRQFLMFYDDLMNQKVVAAIRQQRYSQLFVNYEGAMIGDGEVWISSACSGEQCSPEQIKITAINP